MKQDNFEKWEVEGYSSDLYLYSLYNESQSITIILRSPDIVDKQLKIKFLGVLGYRSFQETARIRTLYENPLLRGFMKSTNSDFLNWFHLESSGVFEKFELIHYYICNSDVIIDIIAGANVNLEWVTTDDYT